MLDQETYETIVFLTRCVYYDIPYPSIYGFKELKTGLLGLRLNLFETDEYYLLIVAGTNQRIDWLHNGLVGLGITPTQHLNALDFAKDIYTEDKPMIIAGHSLGGGIAEYITANINMPNVTCVSFNGCGIKHLVAKGKNIQAKVLNITTSRDLLNGLTEKLPGDRYMKHLSPIIKLEDKTTWNPVKSHCNFDLFMKVKIDDID